MDPGELEEPLLDEPPPSSSSQPYGNRSKSAPASQYRDDSAVVKRPSIVPKFSKKLKDRLCEAQANLVKQDEQRRKSFTKGALSKTDLVAQEGSVRPDAPKKRPTLTRSLTESSAQRSGSGQGGDIEDELPRRVSSGKLRARRGSFSHAVGSVGMKLQSVGREWYEVEVKRNKLNGLLLVQNLYYWCYTGYIVGLVTLGGLAMWIADPETFTFTMAFFSSACCVSQSGLAVVDWSKQSTPTYVISFLLIIGGSAPLLHMAPVLLRRSSFREQAKVAGRSGGTRFRRTNTIDSNTSDRECTPFSSEGDMGRDRLISNDTDLSNPAPGGSPTDSLEYQALGQILLIMIGYWVTVHVLFIVAFYCYFVYVPGKFQDQLREEKIHGLSHAAYLTVSSFQNNGLVITPSSLMDFSKQPIPLLMVSALIILGNTGLPLAVRFIAWVLERTAPRNSSRKRALRYLLQHPRRCFTHMFPRTHTLWLLLVVVVLNALETVIILTQDASGPAFKGLDDWEGVVNAFFQSVSARTAGLNSVNIAELSQGTTFTLVVMMYLATTPTVVTMRLSVAENEDQAEVDITGKAEGVEEDVLTGDDSLRGQARRYLSQDVTYLVLILFLICVCEKEQFEVAARKVSPDSDGIYFDFSFFKVLFEVVSAYGTCGLSLGYQNQTASFSGVWSPASQYLLVIAMLLGRCRGLPDSIDPSVKLSLRAVEDNEGEEKDTIPEAPFQSHCV